MRPPSSFPVALIVALAALAPSARAQSPRQSDDPSSAYALLLRGYELKVQGRCKEAIAPLEASYRAEPTTKALINLAQCEATLGALVRARAHLKTALDLAKRKDPPRVAIAEESLAALEHRIPRVTLTLVDDAPAGTTVRVDGASPSALQDIALDPGPHEVVVTAKDGASRTYPFALAEGEQARLTVDCRPPQPLSAPATAAAAADGSRERTVGFVLAGAGLVGLGVGTYFGLSAHSKNNDSNADGHCDASGCDAVGFALRSDARSAATVSTVGFLVGGAALAAGVVFVVKGFSWSDAAALRVTPTVGLHGGGLEAHLRW